MGRTTSLLVTPPLWNCYAPHLAVPLLAAQLRARGWPVRVLDLSIEATDWILSSHGLASIESKIATTWKRGLISGVQGPRVYDAAVVGIDAAKRALRDPEVLANEPEAYERARVVLRNGVWAVGAAFPNVTFDLFANNSTLYSVTSSAELINASKDQHENIYRWIFDRLLPPVLSDRSIGIVGFSVSADTQILAAVTAARMIRESRPDVTILFGGNYITRIATGWSGDHPLSEFVDAVFLGEGERSLIEYLEQHHGELSYSEIPGVLVTGSSKRARPAPPISLEQNVSPDFSDSPLKNYFAPGPVLPIYASRSCEYQCAFCAIPFASGSFRRRDASRVVAEIEQLKITHSTKYFMFVDEIMTADVLNDISSELITRNIDVYWYGEARFGKFWTSELAKKVRRSGCRKMNLGLESANQRVLNLMRKGTRRDIIDENLTSLMDARVPTHLFAIVGFPGETVSEANETLQFLNRVQDTAQSQYNSSYHTSGVSEFLLDTHSDVARHPESYGVEILELDDHHDLALSIPFSVRHGVSPVEAERLARTAWGDSDGQRWPEINFHRYKKIIPEEESFLRACLDVPFKSKVGRGSKVFDADFDPKQAMLAPRAFISRYSESAVLFYQQDEDLVFDAPREMFSECRAGAEFRPSENPNAKHLFMTLLRHGFLETDSPELAADWSRLSFHKEREPAVLERFDKGRLVLLNSLNGKIAELGEIGRAIWDSLSDGIVWGDVCRSLGVNQIREIRSVVETLLRDRFAYALHR